MTFCYLNQDTGHAFQGPADNSQKDGAEEGDEKHDAGALQSEAEAEDSSDFDEADLDTSVAARKGKACECSTC